MSRRSAIAAIALCVSAVLAAAAPVASAEPSAVIQYSANVPSAGGGDPNTDPSQRLPTVSREVFARVPERDVYALTQIAISPELGGPAGIAGVTGPAYNGAGQTYPAEDVNVADALFGSLGDSGPIALFILAAAMLVAVVATRHRTATPGV